MVHELINTSLKLKGGERKMVEYDGRLIDNISEKVFHIMCKRETIEHRNIQTIKPDWGDL